MKELTIMLVCGGGLSSGFVAKSMKTAAKKKGIKAEIFARSEDDIFDYVSEIDVLLVGPHLVSLMNNESVCEAVRKHGVLMKKIDADLYAMMDGESILNETLKELNKEGE